MCVEVFPLSLKYSFWTINKLSYDKKIDRKKKSWCRNWRINIEDELQENIKKIIKYLNYGLLQLFLKDK